MSEDSVAILCKVDKRSKKKIESIKQTVEAFCQQHDIDAPNDYFEKNMLVLEISFFDSELFDGIKPLLCELAQYAKSNPVARYWLDTVGETLFYAVTNNELREFEKLKDAINTKFTDIPAETINLEEMGLTIEKITLVKLSYTDSKKETLIQYLKDTLLKPVENDSGISNTDISTDWDGEINRLAEQTKFVSDRGSAVVIGLDLYTTNLLPDYPSDEQVAEEIAENKARNKSIIEAHNKSLKEMGIDPAENDFSGAFTFTTNKHICRHELKKFRLVDCVETLLSNFLELKGVTSGSVAFRHGSLERTQEVSAFGGSSDGVYMCSLAELSDIKTWIS